MDAIQSCIRSKYKDQSLRLTQFLLLFEFCISNFAYNNQLYIEAMTSRECGQQEDYRQQPNSKTKYSKTSMKKKSQLIDLVINHHWSIYKASKKLKLSNSTAKSILRNYEKYGAILEKFTKNRIMQLQAGPEEKQGYKNIIKEEDSYSQQPIKQQNEEQKVQPHQGPVIDQKYYPFYAFPYLFVSNTNYSDRL